MDIEKEFSKKDIQFHQENHHFSEEKSFDYDQITDKIFLGTNMCCIIGYADELVKKGIVADISLEKERVDNPTGVDYFLWLPTEDGHPPTAKQLELGVEVIDFFVEYNIKLYAHCKNGHGRAPTLVAAWLISKGMSVEEAVKKIKARRSSIHLSESQIAALEKFHKRKQNRDKK